MADNKKKWSRPQLIVLGRGTPEENVLMACKNTTQASSPNSVNNTKCGIANYVCTDCSGLSSS
jgi:hypothetical protein